MSISSQQASDFRSTLNAAVFQEFSRSSSIQFAIFATIFGIATCLHIFVLVIRLRKKEERWLVKRIGRGDDQCYWCPNGPLTYNIFAVPFNCFLLAQSVIAYKFGHAEGLFPSPTFTHLLPYDIILLFIAGWFLIFSQVYAVCIAYDNSAVRRRLPPRVLNGITYGFPLLALAGLCVVSVLWTIYSIRFFDLFKMVTDPLDESIASGNPVPAIEIAQLYASFNEATSVGDTFLQYRKTYQYVAIAVCATIIVLYTPFCVSLLRLLSRMINQQDFLHAGTVQSSSSGVGQTKRGTVSTGRNSGKTRYRYVMYHSIMLYSYLSWSAAGAALSAIKNDRPATVVLVLFWNYAAHGLAIAVSFAWDAIRHKMPEQPSNSKGETTFKPALSGVMVEQRIELSVDAADDLEEEKHSRNVQNGAV